MAGPNNSTLLSIDGIDFSEWAVRGITMTLSPIATGSLRRDVNGNLVDMTLPQFRKYGIAIACSDHEAPELTGIWRGSIIDVTCIPGLGVENNTDGTLTMQMMVDSFEVQRDEWGAQGNWQLTALQV